MPKPVLLASAAMTTFGRTSKKLIDLLAEAAQNALNQAKLNNIDAIYLGVMNAEEFTGEGNLAVALTDRLGLSGTASSRIETASSTGAGALETAFYAIASGYLNTVLVVAGEKMTGLSTIAATRIITEVIASTERRYGATMPGLAALITNAYANIYRLSEKQLKNSLAAVAIKNHNRGILNPFAQLKKTITLDDHHSAKLIADPLRLYDCAPITDGAAAIVLSNHKGNIRLAGIGHATDTATFSRRGNLVSFNSTKQAALQAYIMAQIQPNEIDFAEVHDAFTMFEIIGTEDLGFFHPGQGWKAVLEGRTSPDGELPINPSGGLKARGHPIGASGLAQVVEAYWLLTGQVNKQRRLAKDPNIALTQSIGGIGNNNLVTILVPADWPLHQPNWINQFHPTIIPSALTRPDPPPGEIMGRLLTTTTIYTPSSNSYKTPLKIGLVRTTNGWQTLVHLLDKSASKIGDFVHLTLIHGLYQAYIVSSLAGPWLQARFTWRRLPTSLRLWRRKLKH